ncbi:MAG: Fe(3+) ABC transporter substrate-binding protein [Alphaproteobacteria bacterium]|nr:Fe(3+) ABC transporter substrate-binding protein [Alphaproteobacteria bacterium]
MTVRIAIVAAALLASMVTVPAAAQQLNLYTARHYQTDEKLYDDFTKATGIKINRIDAKEDEIIERIRQEGANSPADVMITVDMGRIWKAEQAGILQPVASTTLERVVPAYLRDTEGRWFGFSARARVLVIAKDRVKPGALKDYEDLAKPEWKGRVCARSGAHIYNLSLLSSMIATLGEAKAEAWAKGVKENLARPPQGGDTDQIKAVAAGQCDVAITNSYYYVRLINSEKANDKAVVAKTAVVFPNQDNRGTHVNVSGGGVAKNAPNREAAVKFLEYLASDPAQLYFANGNNEWPVTEVPVDNKGLASLGNFKRDQINVAELGRNQAKAQAIMDKVGWK